MKASWRLQLPAVLERDLPGTRERRSFLLGLATGVILALLAGLDPSSLVDSFYQRRAQEQALSIWSRQAASLTYAECLDRPWDCLGRVVVWRVSHPARDVSYFSGTPSQPILWRNPAQVPLGSVKAGPFRAVARVTGVGRAGERPVELLYLGSPDGPYGGTTWGRTFGLEGRSPR